MPAAAGDETGESAPVNQTVKFQAGKPKTTS